MHSTKELARQHEAAKSALDTATKNERLARDRLVASIIADEEARLAAADTPIGSKVTASHRGVNQKTCFVHSVEVPNWGMTPTVRLSKMKKDGTPYANASHITFDEIKPFEETTK